MPETRARSLVAKAPRFDGLTADASLARAARPILRTLLEAVLAESPAVLHGDDVRATHDMRVAIRRLRTALDTFGDELPRKALRIHSAATRRIARRLGKVRDADVHLAVLRGALGGATTDEVPGIAYAIETLAAQRRQALSEFAVELSQFDRDALAALVDDGPDAP
jgi:triphosphatase